MASPTGVAEFERPFTVPAETMQGLGWLALILFVCVLWRVVGDKWRADAARLAEVEREKARQLAAEVAAKEAERAAQEKAARDRHAAEQAKLWAEKEAEAAKLQQQAVRRREIEVGFLADWRRFVLSRHVVPPKHAEFSRDRFDFMEIWLKTAPADAWLLRHTTDDLVKALTDYGSWLPRSPAVQQGTQIHTPRKG